MGADRAVQLKADAFPVDGLAVATKLVEAAGLLAAASVLQHAGRSRPADIPRPKGTLA